MTEHTHRYGDHEQTSVLPPFHDEPQHPAPPKRRGRAASAGILVAALLLGSAGGVAGAAGYDALEGDDPVAATDTPASRTIDSSGSDSSDSLSNPAPRDDTPAPAGSPEAVAEQVLPSVVMITVRGAATSGGPQTGGSGSGVLISDDGEILTNEHVVGFAEGGGQITVSFDDGTSSAASIVGTDPVTDLAVIKAEDVSGLTPAAIGNSDDLGVGESVVAIGSPFGLEATVTSGIVSSLNRAVTVGDGAAGTDTTYPAIQTDAAINPGNSGGPLVNLAGEVVGINSSIRTSSGGLGGEGGSIGLGFAIPITKVLPIVEQLRNGETPTHARLGVSVSNNVGENGLVAGAAVASVEEGSAAEEAGLREGDVVTRVDDHVITGSESLVAIIRGYRPGDEVELTVVRDGEERTLTAALDDDLESSGGGDTLPPPD